MKLIGAAARCSLVLTLFLNPAVSVAEIVFADSFSGTGDLDGAAPDIRPGSETWQSTPGTWSADGTVASGSVHAWLPFSPASGEVCRLSLDVDPDTGSGSNWFALGFSSTNGIGVGFDGPFILNRSDDSRIDVIQTHPGPANHDLNPDQPGFVSLTIELDTRTSPWTVEYSVAGQSIGTSTAIENTQYVGFQNLAVLGEVDNFSLECHIPQPAETVYLTQDATYRFINTTAATVAPIPPDWHEPDFDDSAWSESQGPFSNSGASTFGVDLGNVNDPFGGDDAPSLPTNNSDYIQWDANFDPLVRTEFTLPAPTALTIWIAVDNGIGTYPAVAGTTGLYLNGVESTGSINAEGLAFRWEHVFDVPAEYTYAGRNVIAIQLEDHGSLTSFAMVVTSDDPESQDDFTANPPPPTSVPTFGFHGLALLAALAVAGGLSARHRSPPDRPAF